MNPEEDPKEDRREEKEEAAAEEGNRLLLAVKRFGRGIAAQVQRLKQFLQAGLVRILDASSGALQRLKERVGESGGEEARGDERHAEREPRHEKTPPREERAKAAEPKAVAAPAATPSTLHNVLIYLLILIIGAISGMLFSFALLSTMLNNQAHRIDDQREEISQLEKQQSRITESEAKYRKENNELQKRVNELEADAAAREAAKEATLPEPAESPAIHSTVRQSQIKKTGNCKLGAGNIDGNLTRCIEDFNRK